MVAISLLGKVECTKHWPSVLTLNTLVCAITMNCSKNSLFYFSGFIPQQEPQTL